MLALVHQVIDQQPGSIYRDRVRGIFYPSKQSASGRCDYQDIFPSLLLDVDLSRYSTLRVKSYHTIFTEIGDYLRHDQYINRPAIESN